MAACAPGWGGLLCALTDVGSRAERIAGRADEEWQQALGVRLASYNLPIARDASRAAEVG